VEEKPNELQKTIIIIQCIALPASLAIGLGLYGIVVTDEAPFIPALNNEALCYGLVIIGALLEILAITKVITLLSKNKK